MVSQMTHRERLQASLKGQEVDRVPVSMWRHFFDKESSHESMAEAMLAFQRCFDWDFMKVNPRASYHAEGWGLQMRYDGDAPPQVVRAPVQGPDDWLRVEPLPVDKGVLGDHLHALGLIAAGLGGDVPFLMTVFTPLSIASRLAPSEEVFLQHLREHPEKVQCAVEAITDTFSLFARACLERGASGLFYATTAWATTLRLTEEEYLRLARPSDLKLLEAVSGADFNILHVCRDRNMLSLLQDYPAHAFNWDARGQGNPSLMEGKSILGERMVLGGLSHRETLVKAEPRTLADEVQGMRVAMGGSGWMLGPGCTFTPETPEDNIRAIRQAVEAA